MGRLVGNKDRYAEALFNIKVTPEVLRHSLEKD